MSHSHGTASTDFPIPPREPSRGGLAEPVNMPPERLASSTGRLASPARAGALDLLPVPSEEAQHHDLPDTEPKPKPSLAYELFRRGLDEVGAHTRFSPVSDHPTLDSDSALQPEVESTPWLSRLEGLEQQFGGAIVAAEMNRSKISQIASLIVKNRLPGITLIIVHRSLQHYWACQLRATEQGKSLRIMEYSGRDREYQDLKTQRRLHYKNMRTFDVIVTNYSTIDQEFHAYSLWIRSQYLPVYDPADPATHGIETYRRRPDCPLIQVPYLRLVFDDGHKLAKPKSNQLATLCALKAKSRVILAPPWLWANQLCTLRYLQLLRILPVEGGEKFQQGLNSNSLSERDKVFLFSLVQSICVFPTPLTTATPQASCQLGTDEVSVEANHRPEPLTIEKQDVVDVSSRRKKQPPPLRLSRIPHTPVHDLRRAVFQPCADHAEGALGRAAESHLAPFHVGQQDYRIGDGDAWDWDCFQKTNSTASEQSSTGAGKKRKADEAQMDSNEDEVQDPHIPLAIQTIREERDTACQPGIKKILVISRFLRLLDGLGNALEHLDCVVSRYDKTMSSEALVMSVARFVKGSKPLHVLLMTTTCSHEQIDLSCATTVVFLTPHANPFVERRCIKLVTAFKEPADHVAILRLHTNSPVEHRVMEVCGERESQSIALEQPLGAIDRGLYQQLTCLSLEEVRQLLDE